MFRTPEQPRKCEQLKKWAEFLAQPGLKQGWAEGLRCAGTGGHQLPVQGMGCGSMGQASNRDRLYLSSRPL